MSLISAGSISLDSAFNMSINFLSAEYVIMCMNVVFAWIKHLKIYIFYYYYYICLISLMLAV